MKIKKKKKKEGSVSIKRANIRKHKKNEWSIERVRA